MVRAWALRLQRAPPARVGGARSAGGAHTGRRVLRAARRAPAAARSGSRWRTRDDGRRLCRRGRLMLGPEVRANDFLVAESNAMRAVAAQIRSYADGEAPVLICGEHG